MPPSRPGVLFCLFGLSGLFCLFCLFGPSGVYGPGEMGLGCRVQGSRVWGLGFRFRVNSFSSFIPSTFDICVIMLYIARQ